MSYGEESGPLAIAHRGGAALAPENSLAAFALAAALGLRYLETDVRVTRDGQLVCFHDDTVGRTTSAVGRVRQLTLPELKTLRIDEAEPIPTLDEALDAFPEHCFTVDLKDQRAIGPLVRSLRRPGVAERVCVAGAWDGWLGQVRREVPGVTTTLGWWSLTALLSCARAGVRPPRALAAAPFAHVPVTLGQVPILVERLVAMAHDLGVRVVAWTVDDPLLMRRLLDVGVDALITDRPDLLREVLLSRGQWAPMGSPARPDPAALPDSPTPTPPPPPPPPPRLRTRRAPAPRSARPVTRAG